MSLDSHHLAQVLCRPRSRVLDVGCGDGTVAQMLADLGCTVVGLDISDDAVAAMGERGMEAHQIDLDVDKLDEVLGDGDEFDVILCLDVLEHTKRPAEVLSSLLERLVSDGDVVISLPNITHGDVRVRLLGGEFRYRDEGLLDATHLRFFDRPALDALLQQCGLEMREFHPVRFPIGGTELGVDPSEIPDGLRELIAADEESEIYQWVFRAQRAGEQSPAPALHGLLKEAEERKAAQLAAEDYARRLAGELGAVTARLGEIEAHIKNDLETHIASVEAELAAVEAARLDDRDRFETEAMALREEIDLLGREVAAKDDVVAIVSEENDAHQARIAALEQHGSELAGQAEAARAQAAAIESRRVYRLVDGGTRRLLHLPLAGRVLRRLAG